MLSLVRDSFKMTLGDNTRANFRESIKFKTFSVNRVRKFAQSRLSSELIAISSECKTTSRKISKIYSRRYLGRNIQAETVIFSTFRLMPISISHLQRVVRVEMTITPVI